MPYKENCCEGEIFYDLLGQSVRINHSFVLEDYLLDKKIYIPAADVNGGDSV